MLRVGIINETIHYKIYAFYRDYIERYPQYFKKNVTFDIDTQPYLAIVRAQVYMNFEDAVNLTPNIKNEIAQTINLTGKYLDIWNNFSVLILDNNGFNIEQLNVIQDLLSKVPVSLYKLGSITQMDLLGNPWDENHIWFATRYSINIFDVDVGSWVGNNFPDDVLPKYADGFTIVLAHELNHIVDAYYIEGNSSLKNRKMDLLNAASNDHMNYLRSMLEDGFFQQAPQEFFASMANEYFSSSAHTLDVGIVRRKNEYMEPLKQFLFFADVYSLGENYTRFYTVDEEGNIEVRNIGLERDNNGKIKYLSIINLTLNGIDDNIKINPGESINITASLETDQEIKYVEIYQDGELLVSGESPLNYTLIYNNIGIHNITATYPINESCFISYEIHLIFVGNVQPVVNFSYLPLNPTTGDIIQFTDLSYDSGSSVVNWTWNFGDGNISYLQNPVHQYADDGTYNVTLTVMDDDGATNVTSKQITISKIQHTLTTSVDPSGSGTITLNPSGGTYDEGTVVTATANANSGYQFDHWSGDTIGTLSSTTVTMNRNKSITAHFVRAGTLSITRSMPSFVDLGDTFVVTLTPSDYGTFGEINETLPAGFTYVTSSLPSYQVSEWSNGVTFTIFGDTTFTYTVTAPNIIAQYIFSGVLKDEDKNIYTVGGDCTITVGWAPWIYDTQPPFDTITKSEVISAVMDYFADQITKEQVIQVVMLYFSS